MDEPHQYSRPALVGKLKQQSEWDVVIIGGGATGLGVALDSASRGFSTLLLEQHDFAKGTSSRSTKLVHGGVRYLAQGDLGLVYSALHERNLLCRNAEHVVKQQSFVIPCYSYGELLKYGAGLKLYDLLAGFFNFGRSRFLSKKKTAERLPNISVNNLKGGIEYFDGQFDDARLAVNIAQSAIDHSAVVLNYFSVIALLKEGKRISGVKARDLESGEHFDLKAKVVVNATGVYVDDILRMDEPGARKLVRPSQGVHIVVDKKFLNGASALMIPRTTDGRVLFAVPWHQHLVVGTTDTPVIDPLLEPQAKDDEIRFILSNLEKYFKQIPGRNDVLSVFAGLRPLAAEVSNTSATKELSRDHKLIISRSGLVTITGGKWTTYRKMAEHTVDAAIRSAALPRKKSLTANIKLHGSMQATTDHLSVYGSDAANIRKLITEDPSTGKLLVEGHPYTVAEVIWAVRNEMARTVEDVLARRIRLLFLDVDAAMLAAPLTSNIIGKELGYSEEKMQAQVKDFISIASGYKLNK